MSYRFAGFLAPSATEIIEVSSLPPDAIYRRVTTPFIGVGVSFPSMIGEEPSNDEVNKLAVAIGITQARSWLYITYDTWAGSIDWMYAIGAQQGVEFGPINDSNLETVRDTFIDVMARIGLGTEHAVQFGPFSRGFWGPGS